MQNRNTQHNATKMIVPEGCLALACTKDNIQENIQIMMDNMKSKGASLHNVRMGVYGANFNAT
jgi:hypothetical protein